MRAVIYRGYWPDPNAVLKYALGYVTAGLIFLLLLVSAAALVRGRDGRVSGVTPPIRRGRRRSLQEPASASSSAVGPLTCTPSPTAKPSRGRVSTPPGHPAPGVPSPPSELGVSP